VLADFDAPSVFAALLDPGAGSFELHPVGDRARLRQVYLPDTNVLLTRFLYRDGVAEISDFMWVRDQRPAGALVRRIKAIRGRIRCQMNCAPRFDYGRSAHDARRDGDAVVFECGVHAPGLRLASSVQLSVDATGRDARAEFELAEGASAWFALESPEHGRRFRGTGDVSRAFRETSNFWRRWSAQIAYAGRWREVVSARRWS